MSFNIFSAVTPEVNSPEGLYLPNTASHGRIYVKPHFSLPSGTMEVIQVACGRAHTIFLCRNGDVWGCGANDFGQLGLDGSVTNQLTSVRIASLSGIKYVACGLDFSIFVKSDGSVLSCGDNTYGQTGLGRDISAQYTPAVIADLADIERIVCGGYFCFYISTDGTVWGTGRSHLGQLTINNSPNNFTPVLLPILTGAQNIAAGTHYTLYRDADGMLWSVGQGLQGQLGHGNFNNVSIPKQLSLSGVKDIAAGPYQSFFLLENGTVLACGKNVAGQLGIGTSDNQNSPIAVSGLNDITQVVGGENHSIFRHANGAVSGTGRNNIGQLGIESLSSTTVPRQIPLSDIRDISSGSNYSVFTQSDLLRFACGENDQGQFGIGSIESPIKSPVQIPNFDAARRNAVSAYPENALLVQTTHNQPDDVINIYSSGFHKVNAAVGKVYLVTDGIAAEQDFIPHDGAAATGDRRLAGTKAVISPLYLS